MTTAPKLNGALIAAEGIGYSIEDRTLIESVSLRLLPGDIICIVGENGSGKSVLLSMLGGLRQPSKGIIRFAEPPPSGSAVMVASRRSIEGGASLTVGEVLASSSGSARSGTQTAMDRFHLSETRLVGSLSMGEQQRVVLALAWLSCAPAVVFDSPTLGLDSDGYDMAEDLVNEIADAHRGVIIATTDPEVVLRFNRSSIYSIGGGTIRMVREPSWANESRSKYLPTFWNLGSH